MEWFIFGYKESLNGKTFKNISVGSNSYLIHTNGRFEPEAYR
ncbi:hypothetical protein AQPE_1830 [Aquipluma nitroreducens]|uniref:Uncharacterized protein n=1 Tax=Aquipluma nitroreducens TaxID=2010828 RepID=A0A5K7S7Z2_9BACT|nr:hypothetical protein AQPE_1830 [Aquipluma nitroreducens]